MGSVGGRIERQGPIISVGVMASPDRVVALKAAGQSFPKPLTVRALIDTGASCSAVDVNIAMSLGLQSTSAFPVYSPTSGSGGTRLDVYDVSLVLNMSRPDARTYTVGMIGATLANQGFCALIGWDVLRHCDLICRGRSGRFTLRF